MAAPTPKEIRECYSDYRSEWQDIRDEAGVDMRYVVGDPWEPEDRRNREDVGRPCVSLDELNQYLNQAINNVRQNKRAIQVRPKGEGADDRLAKSRSALIMGIEERSQAQLAYITAFESAIQRSYGFFVLRTEYSEDSSFDQEICIKPIVNPDTVLISPQYKQPDAHDIEDAFLLELYTRERFKSRWPDAEITDFSGDTSTPGISEWIKAKFIQVGEFWKIEHRLSKLLLVETAKGPQIFTDKEWKELKDRIRGEVKRERQVRTPSVMQYMTNGLEILEEHEWPGTRIPIISVFGKEVWITQAGEAKRKLLSMVRLARDAQMACAYFRTTQLEVAGLMSKAGWLGAKGQFESDQEAFEESNQVPHAMLQYDAMTDPTGQSPLPPPQRVQLQADFGQFEVAIDSCRRAIQSAMGISPLPTPTQKQNEKSGVALERIQTSEAIGSFHFTDNYDRALENAGWQLNEIIPKVYDTEREMTMVEPDGSHKAMRVTGSTSHPLDDQGTYEVQSTIDEGTLPEEHHHTGVGAFEPGISTGPSYQSQREEQSEFVDQLVSNMPNLPQPGTPQAKVLALAIRMRPDLGPVGEQIAEVFDPPDPSNLPPAAQQIIQNLQAQMQQLQQENAALHMDRAGRVLEQQTKIQIEGMRGKNKMDERTMELITKVVGAELAKGSQQDQQQAQADADKELTLLGLHDSAMDRAHEHAMQVVDHAHQQDLAAKAAQNAHIQQASQQAADQQSQEAQQQS